MFGRKRTIDDVHFGTMSYAHDEWMSAASVPTNAAGIPRGRERIPGAHGPPYDVSLGD
jgi:hypothetical protein